MIMKAIGQEAGLDSTLFRQGDRVIAAVSGGCDSVCLLLCLQEMAAAGRLSLSVLHVHHGIRGEAADGDEAFVKALCGKMQLPLTLCRTDAPALASAEGLSLEDAARRLRYDCLLTEARKAREALRESGAGEDGRVLIALAHHRGDQAETVLLHLLRGAGEAGLGGMARLREAEKGIWLVRPFLQVGKKRLQSVLEDLGQDWREDESNADTAYRRNYLRRELLPALEEHFPGAEAGILRTADNLRETEAYLEAETAKLLPLVTAGGRPDPTDSLKTEALKAQAPLMRKRLLRLWLEAQGGLKDVGAVHYEALLQLLEGQSGRELFLPGGRQVLREQTLLRLRRDGDPEKSAGACSGDENGELTAQDGGRPLLSWHSRSFPYEKSMKIPDTPCTKWMDYDKIKHLRFRTREAGDYFHLPSGGRKSLKEYMIEQKIPAAERGRVPLFADGSHVLWLVGYRLSAAVRLTEETRTVLEITVEDSHEGTHR